MDIHLAAAVSDVILLASIGAERNEAPAGRISDEIRKLHNVVYSLLKVVRLSHFGEEGIRPGSVVQVGEEDMVI